MHHELLIIHAHDYGQVRYLFSNLIPTSSSISSYQLVTYYWTTTMPTKIKRTQFKSAPTTTRHSQGTDELVVEALHHMHQLVGLLEALARSSPPSWSEELLGTRGAALCIEPGAGWRAMCMRMYA